MITSFGAPKQYSIGSTEPFVWLGSSPCQRFLAALTHNSVYIWSNGQHRALIGHRRLERHIDFGVHATAVWSPNSTRLFVCTAPGKSVCIYQLSGGVSPDGEDGAMNDLYDSEDGSPRVNALTLKDSPAASPSIPPAALSLDLTTVLNLPASVCSPCATSRFLIFGCKYQPAIVFLSYRNLRVLSEVIYLDAILPYRALLPSPSGLPSQQAQGQGSTTNRSSRVPPGSLSARDRDSSRQSMVGGIYLFDPKGCESLSEHIEELRRSSKAVILAPDNLPKGGSRTPANQGQPDSDGGQSLQAHLANGDASTSSGAGISLSASLPSKPSEALSKAVNVIATSSHQSLPPVGVVHVSCDERVDLLTIVLSNGHALALSWRLPFLQSSGILGAWEAAEANGLVTDGRSARDRVRERGPGPIGIIMHTRATQVELNVYERVMAVACIGGLIELINLKPLSCEACWTPLKVINPAECCGIPECLSDFGGITNMEWALDGMAIAVGYGGMGVAVYSHLGHMLFSPFRRPESKSPLLHFGSFPATSSPIATATANAQHFTYAYSQPPHHGEILAGSGRQQQQQAQQQPGPGASASGGAAHSSSAGLLLSSSDAGTASPFAPAIAVSSVSSLCMCWASEGLALVSASPSSPGVVVEFSMYRSVATGGPPDPFGPEGHPGGPFFASDLSSRVLIGPDRLLICESPPWDPLSPAWVQVPLPPPAYTHPNWPLRDAALSPSCDWLLVAGRRGLALMGCRSRRWRLFGNVQHEARVAAVGVGWYNNSVLFFAHSDSDAPRPSQLQQPLVVVDGKIEPFAPLPTKYSATPGSAVGVQSPTNEDNEKKKTTWCITLMEASERLDLDKAIAKISDLPARPLKTFVLGPQDGLSPPITLKSLRGSAAAAQATINNNNINGGSDPAVADTYLRRLGSEQLEDIFAAFSNDAQSQIGMPPRGSKGSINGPLGFDWNSVPLPSGSSRKGSISSTKGSSQEPILGIYDESRQLTAYRLVVTGIEGGSSSSSWNAVGGEEDQDGTDGWPYAKSRDPGTGTAGVGGMALGAGRVKKYGVVTLWKLALDGLGWIEHPISMRFVADQNHLIVGHAGGELCMVSFRGEVCSEDDRQGDDQVDEMADEEDDEDEDEGEEGSSGVRSKSARTPSCADSERASGNVFRIIADESAPLARGVISFWLSHHAQLPEFCPPPAPFGSVAQPAESLIAAHSTSHHSPTLPSHATPTKGKGSHPPSLNSSHRQDVANGGIDATRALEAAARLASAKANEARARAAGIEGNVINNANQLEGSSNSLSTTASFRSLVPASERPSSSDSKGDAAGTPLGQPGPPTSVTGGQGVSSGTRGKGGTISELPSRGGMVDVSPATISSEGNKMWGEVIGLADVGASASQRSNRVVYSYSPHVLPMVTVSRTVNQHPSNSIAKDADASTSKASTMSTPRKSNPQLKREISKSASMVIADQQGAELATVLEKGGGVLGEFDRIPSIETSKTNEGAGGGTRKDKEKGAELSNEEGVSGRSTREEGGMFAVSNGPSMHRNSITRSGQQQNHFQFAQEATKHEMFSPRAVRRPANIGNPSLALRIPSGLGLGLGEGVGLREIGLRKADPRYAEELRNLLAIQPSVPSGLDELGSISGGLYVWCQDAAGIVLISLARTSPALLPPNDDPLQWRVTRMLPIDPRPYPVFVLYIVAQAGAAVVCSPVPVFDTPESSVPSQELRLHLTPVLHPMLKSLLERSAFQPNHPVPVSPAFEAALRLCRFLEPSPMFCNTIELVLHQALDKAIPLYGSVAKQLDMMTVVTTSSTLPMPIAVGKGNDGDRSTTHASHSNAGSSAASESASSSAFAAAPVTTTTPGPLRVCCQTYPEFRTLGAALALLKNFEDSGCLAESLVSCIRKTEPLTSPVILFPLGGLHPHALWSGCVARGMLKTASLYLVVLQNLVGPLRVRAEYVLPLARVAAKAGHLSLFKSLVTFFKALYVASPSSHQPALTVVSLVHASPSSTANTNTNASASTIQGSPQSSASQFTKPAAPLTAEAPNVRGERHSTGDVSAHSMATPVSRGSTVTPSSGPQRSRSHTERQIPLMRLWRPVASKQVAPPVLAADSDGVDRMEAAQLYVEIEDVVGEALVACFQTMQWLRFFALATELRLDVPAWLAGTSPRMARMRAAVVATVDSNVVVDFGKPGLSSQVTMVELITSFEAQLVASVRPLRWRSSASTDLAESLRILEASLPASESGGAPQVVPELDAIPRFLLRLLVRLELISHALALAVACGSLMWVDLLAGSYPAQAHAFANAVRAELQQTQHSDDAYDHWVALLKAIA